MIMLGHATAITLKDTINNQMGGAVRLSKFYLVGWLKTFSIDCAAAYRVFFTLDLFCTVSTVIYCTGMITVRAKQGDSAPHTALLYRWELSDFPFFQIMK